MNQANQQSTEMYGSSMNMEPVRTGIVEDLEEEKVEGLGIINII